MKVWQAAARYPVRQPSGPTCTKDGVPGLRRALPSRWQLLCIDVEGAQQLAHLQAGHPHCQGPSRPFADRRSACEQAQAAAISLPELQGRAACAFSQ